MIILRNRKIKLKNKIFNSLLEDNDKNKRDPLPEPFEQPDEWGEYETKYRIRRSDQYNKDMSGFGEVEKQYVRKLVKDIKNGYIYTDGPNGGDTHYLKKYSNPNKYHRMSKSINTFDRLVYSIYSPKLEEDVETGEKVIAIPIIINSLKGHNIPGQGLYSNVEEY